MGWAWPFWPAKECQGPIFFKKSYLEWNQVSQVSLNANFQPNWTKIKMKFVGGYMPPQGVNFSQTYHLWKFMQNYCPKLLQIFSQIDSSVWEISVKRSIFGRFSNPPLGWIEIFQKSKTTQFKPLWRPNFVQKTENLQS